MGFSGIFYRVALVLTIVWMIIGPSYATDYGVYDSRALAMGGAMVAGGNNDNAIFYNPALLALYDEFEEDTLDSRFLFPLIVPQASDSGIELGELAADDTDLRLTQAVNDFNANPSAINAQAVVNITAEVQNAFIDLSKQDLLADIYIGLALSEPSKRQGGGFFLGSRIVGGGSSDVTTEDLTLLEDYQVGLAFVASAGAQGVAHPELFDANGNLLDPNANLNSSAEGRGAVITELGVAMSNEFKPWGKPIALGMTFKAMRIDAFEEVERIIEGGLGSAENETRHLTLNMDVGAAVTWGEHLRIGLAVKDVLPKNFETGLSNEIRLRARPRLGLAYKLSALSVAFDFDLEKTEPLGAESPSQTAALGSEWAVLPFARLRAGIKHDIEGSRGTVVSFGTGLTWKRFLFDLAYADGDQRAAAFQFGYAF